MLSTDALPPNAMNRRATERERNKFRKVRNAERHYSQQLVKVARHVNDLVNGLFDPTLPRVVGPLEQALRHYAELLRPWARAVGARMLADVNQRDTKAWFAYSEELGLELRNQLTSAPVGDALRRMLDEQVELITSLPLEAGRRAQQLAMEGLSSGRRPNELREMILQTGHVTRSRAQLIARTETAKAASGLTEVRARAVGSEGYIWRTVHDRVVRKSHREMEGQYVRWNEPPEVDPGKRYHAGQFPNCRCWAEVVIPKD